MLLTASVGIRAVVAVASVASLTTPILTMIPDSSDSTPGFFVDTKLPVSGDVIALEWATTNAINPDGSFSSSLGLVSTALTSGAFTTWAFNELSGILGNATYYFHVRHSRGATNSAWSNTVSQSISVMPLVQTDWPSPRARQQPLQSRTSYYTS